MLSLPVWPWDAAPKEHQHVTPIFHIDREATYARIKLILLLIQSILPCPEPHTLDNSQHARLLTRRCPALVLLRFEELAFDCEDGFLDSAGFNIGTRSWR